MALSVRLVTPATLSELTTIHAAVVAGHHEPLRCAQSPDYKYPTLEWLVACVDETPPHHEVSVAFDGDVVAGLAVIHLRTQRILWLCVNIAQPVRFGTVASALCEAIKTRHGIAWGNIENGDVRQEMIDADPRFGAQGERMEWSS